jgi:hypothetical protein
MIWLNKNLNIISKEELGYLQDRIKNFTVSQKPTDRNYYYREFLSSKKSPELVNIILKIGQYVKDTTQQQDIKISGIWINKVFEGSNISNGMHKDNSELTFIMYLNNDFSGGEFEYKDINKKKIKITPTKNLSIISNKHLKHRVLPVTSGERYSLVIFFNSNIEREKTLI